MFLLLVLFNSHRVVIVLLHVSLVILPYLQVLNAEAYIKLCRERSGRGFCLK